MRLSVTTDMFNYSFNPGLDEKLSLFKKHGFDFLHWCDNWNDDVIYTGDQMKEHAKAVSDHGLTCLDVHGTATHEYSIDALDDIGQRGYIKLLDNRVQFCSEMGGDAVVVHPPRVYGPNLEKRVHRSKKALESARDLCLDLGVTLAIENCSRDDHHILEDYFALYEPEFISFCYDSGHANINGNLDYLMGFGNRLNVIHLHDNKGTSDDHQYPGWGTIDWDKVSAWLKELDYDKPWNLEVTHNPGHFEGTMDEFLKTTKKSSHLF